MPKSSLNLHSNRRRRKDGVAALLLLALAVLASMTHMDMDIAHADIANQSPPEIQGGDGFPHVELVTMGVGSLIWERHGHIALCIRWTEPSRDRCYNYGVANFADPIAMGISFFRSEPSFWVAATTPQRLMATYINADRTVWIQRLPLTAKQKRKVIDKLRFDIRKENRYYSYDHFFDNCTTRVRDVLDDAMDGAIHKIETPIGDRTIRDYARKGFLGDRIALLITDTFMGRVTDKIPTYWERLYLPEYLRDAFQTEFNVEPRVFYQRKGPPSLEEGPSGRFVLFLIILLVTAPAWLTRMWGRFQRLGLAIAAFLPGLLGLIIWTGVIVSPVSYVRWNEAFFIFMPMDLALPFLWRRKIARRYAQIRVVELILVSLLLAVGIFRQPLWVHVLLPLIPCALVAFPKK